MRPETVYKKISTHAPRVRRDVVLTEDISTHVISTHAPRVRRDNGVLL